MRDYLKTPGLQELPAVPGIHGLDKGRDTPLNDDQPTKDLQQDPPKEELGVPTIVRTTKVRSRFLLQQLHLRTKND